MTMTTPLRFKSSLTSVITPITILKIQYPLCQRKHFLSKRLPLKKKMTRHFVRRSISSSNRLTSLCLVTLALVWFTAESTRPKMPNIEILDMMNMMDDDDREDHNKLANSNNGRLNSDKDDKLMSGSGSRAKELDAGGLLALTRSRGTSLKSKSKGTVSSRIVDENNNSYSPGLANSDKEPFCGYQQDDQVHCECDLDRKSYTCRFKSEDGLRNGLRALLNSTHTYYWDELIMVCESPIGSDRSLMSSSPEMPFLHLRWWPLRIQRSLFLNGPVFERVHLTGNCSFSSLFLKGLDEELKSLTIDNCGQSILQHEFSVAANGDFHMKMSRLEDISIIRTRFENDILPKYLGRQPRFNILNSLKNSIRSPFQDGHGGRRDGAIRFHADVHRAGEVMQLSTVKRFRINKCELKTVEDDAFGLFPAIEEIDLSHNRLTSLSDTIFRGCLHLRDLNLERNRLTHLGESLFTEMKTLRRLNLRENNLALLPVIFSPNTFHHQELMLERNPWNCRCKMSWLIAKNSIGRTWFDEPVCEDPETVRGKPLLQGLAHVYEKFC